MGKSITISRLTRRNFIELIDSLSIEQLNEIPVGLNNNIAWNFGHIIVTQQILCYLLAGLTPKMDQALVAKYRKGARPDELIDLNEINILKSLAYSLLDELENDIKDNKILIEDLKTKYSFEEFKLLEFKLSNVLESEKHWRRTASEWNELNLELKSNVNNRNIYINIKWFYDWLHCTFWQ